MVLEPASSHYDVQSTDPHMLNAIHIEVNPEEGENSISPSKDDEITIAIVDSEIKNLNELSPDNVRFGSLRKLVLDTGATPLDDPSVDDNKEEELIFRFPVDEVGLHRHESGESVVMYLWWMTNGSLATGSHVVEVDENDG